jgi:arylsulfatase
MRRPIVISIAVLTSILLVAVAVTLRPRPRPLTSTERDGASSPPHFFLADDRSNGRLVDCGASATADRIGHLPDRPLFPCRFEHGWLRPAPWGTWSNAKRSRLTVMLADPAPRRMLLECKAQAHPDHQRPQTMAVEVNDHPVANLEIPTDWTEFSVAVPAEIQRRGENLVSFEFGYTATEEPTDHGRHERMLSVAFSRISLERTSESIRDRLRRTAPIARSQVWNDDRNRFVLAGGGRLVLPLTIPEGAATLELEIHVPSKLERDQSKILLALETVDGTASRTVRLPIGDVRFETTPNVLRGQISVAEFAGGTCLLELVVEPRPRSALVEVGLPRTMTAAGPSPSPASPSDSAGERDGERMPDIVLITLDAARADHFGCYGYRRPTTPNIDRLAEESLVFRNAYALAPYTLNSVATMITGLSFLDHGVVAKGDTLGDDATTLAESLRTAGYRTVCFSGTPNNSRSRNFHQGYDEFYMVWRKEANRRDRDPHLLSREVVRWLSTYDDSAPLHMQLHYVPPHGPYTPAPRFDLFSDPDYQGQCDGESTSLRAINDRRIRPTETDLRQIVALYDGNLRAADNAVGMVIEALQRRPRWRQTVVLITADHGEAFFEHGMMVHSSTVYGEMLHVPFILRVPRPPRPDGVDTVGLVSLADIVPTLLGTARLEPDSLTEGTDLLRASDQNSLAGRYILTRNGNQLPLLGLRSLHWNAILTSTGHGELYDLDADPGEVRDLYLDQPSRFVGLALLISRRVDRPPSVSASTETARFDDEERSMLEALGYVE